MKITFDSTRFGETFSFELEIVAEDYSRGRYEYWGFWETDKPDIQYEIGEVSDWKVLVHRRADPWMSIDIEERAKWAVINEWFECEDDDILETLWEKRQRELDSRF